MPEHTIKSAREGKSLALSTRKFLSAFADDRVIALGTCIDKGSNSGYFGGLPYVFHRGIWGSVGNVIFDGSLEQEYILTNKGVKAKGDKPVAAKSAAKSASKPAKAAKKATKKATKHTFH